MTHASRKAFAVLGAGLVASALTAPTASADPSTPPPSGVTIEVAHVSRPGGCEAPGVALPPSFTGFTLTHSRYHARAGGSSAPADSRMKCSISLGIHVPRGYTFAIDRVEYRGGAEVAAGATAFLRARHYFQGMGGDPIRPPHKIPGPYSGNWSFVEDTPSDQLVFRPCGESRTLALEGELQVDAGTSDPSKTSSIWQDFPEDRTAYSLFWKTCP